MIIETDNRIYTIIKEKIANHQGALKVLEGSSNAQLKQEHQAIISVLKNTLAEIRRCVSRLKDIDDEAFIIDTDKQLTGKKAGRGNGLISRKQTPKDNANKSPG